MVFLSADYEQWTRISHRFVKRPVLRFLVLAARTAASFPFTTILCGISLSFTVIAAGLLTNFELETNNDFMWSPINSKPIIHSNWVYRESGFSPPTRDVRVIIHRDGANVLNKQVAGCLMELVESLRSLEEYGLSCRCSWDREDCPIRSASSFFGHNRSLFDKIVSSDEDVLMAFSSLHYDNGSPVSRTSIFGSPKPESTVPDRLIDNNSSYLESATALLLEISQQPALSESKDFDSAATNLVFSIREKWKRDKIHCSAEVFTDRTFEDEIERGVSQAIPFVASAFVIIGGFCALYFASWNNLLRSQSLLGVGAVATVSLSIMTSFGLLFAVGVPFTNMTQIFPYVMVGVALDDTFILVEAFNRTDQEKIAVDRVEDAINKVGMSIFISTLTSAFAFFLGYVGTLPIVRWFSLYAGTTIFIDFLYQITFFMALLVLDDCRIKARRYDCCFCFKSSAPRSSQRQQESSSVHRKFMENYAIFLLQKPTKQVVLFTFACLLGFGIYGTTHQEESFDFRDPFPVDSPVRTYFEALTSYASPEAVFDLNIDVYFRNVDVPSHRVRDQMEAYVDELVDTPFVSKQPRNFWLHDFEKYAAQTGNSTPSAIPSNNDQIAIFLNESGQRFREHIVRDHNGSITASRCTLVMDKSSLFDTQVQIDTVKSLRAVTERQPLNQGTDDWRFFVFGNVLLTWELYFVITNEIVLTVAAGLGGVFLICVAFIPHPIGCLLLTAIVAAIYVELMAFLRLVGVYINVASATALFMSIGLVLDYNMHIVVAYFDIKDATSRNKRVTKVLTTMGVSISVGGFSTLLGVLPIVFASNFLRVFFWTYLAIPILGIAHGLILVPVILSLLGPMGPALEEGNREDTDPQSEVEFQTETTEI